MGCGGFDLVVMRRFLKGRDSFNRNGLWISQEWGLKIDPDRRGSAVIMVRFGWNCVILYFTWASAEVEIFAIGE